MDAGTFDRAIVDALVGEGRVVVIEQALFHPKTLDELAGRIRSIASGYVRAHPLRYGIDKEELRQKIGFPHATPLFNKVLEHVSRSQALFFKDNRVRTDTEHVQLDEETSAALDSLAADIERAGMLFARTADVEGSWTGGHALSDALQYLRDVGAIRRIGADGYIHTTHFQACLRRLNEFFDANAELKVADFKDLFGMTRKHAIPLLEFLDESRITVRRGDVRQRGPAMQAAVDR
jgi:selenocysteine-specific elongation factor